MNESPTAIFLLHCSTKFYQGRNEGYFFTTDPIFLPKILIPDPKSDENFDPLSRKNMLIPGDLLFIILSGCHKNVITVKNDHANAKYFSYKKNMKIPKTLSFIELTFHNLKRYFIDANIVDLL